MSKLKDVIEKREGIEVRVEGDDSQGIVRAYLTKWGTVDSYNTTFIRGAFKKTFEQRFKKIRVLWNHDPLAGKLLRAGEDDIGPWVEVQLNLETRAGSEAFAHIKAGDINCFSFGFNRLQAREGANGITEITEVRCVEVSPVVFEANSEAEIVEIRAEDFNETLDIQKLRGEGWRLFDALANTIDDIMWNENTNDETLSKVDTAIADFHMSYIQWLNDYVVQFRDNKDAMDELRKTKDPLKNELRKMDPDEILKSTPLTQDELDILTRGGLLPFESRKKLSDLPDALREAHQSKRCEAVFTLCNELRESGLSELETKRVESLLGLSKRQSGEEFKRLAEAIDSLNF